LAQAESAFGITTGDYDLDGRDDLFLAGNYDTGNHDSGRWGGGVSVWLRGTGDGAFDAVGVPASGLFVPEDARGVATGDLDGDARPDLLVAVYGGEPRLFRNRGTEGRRGLAVRLEGPPGNPSGVGARVSVERADGSVLVKEVHAGAGYLSQDSATVIFGLGEDPAPVAVRVRWPDGRTSALADVSPGGQVVVRP
jgi:hypothetical protein